MMSAALQPRTPEKADSRNTEVVSANVAWLSHLGGQLRRWVMDLCRGDCDADDVLPAACILLAEKLFR